MGNGLMVLPPTQMENAGSSLHLGEDSKFSVKGFGVHPAGMVAGVWMADSAQSEGALPPSRVLLELLGIRRADYIYLEKGY